MLAFLHTFKMCSYMTCDTVKNLVSASSEIISSSDHSDIWPIKCAHCDCCGCLMCFGLHTEVKMGGQPHLSLVGGEMPGRLGCVCMLLNWLYEQIRKESEPELLILGLFHSHSPLFPVCLSLCSCRSESWPALRHQKLPDGLIGTLF